MIRGDKKLVGAYMLEILTKNTNTNYSKTIEDIISEIYEKYGVKVDNRTIRRYLKSLVSSGYKIKSEIYEKSNYNAKAYYLENEENEKFSDAEVRYIIDSIVFSKHIDRKIGKKIIDKFGEFYSVPLVNSLKYINNLKFDKLNKFYDSSRFFLNIDLLHDAIKRKQKLEIKFNEYYEASPSKTKKHKNKQNVLGVYRIAPFYLVASNDVYHLLGYNEEASKGNEIYDLRVDHIESIEVVGQFGTNEKKALKIFDLDKYLIEHPIMGYGEVIDCTFHYRNDRAIDVYDFFGYDVSRANIKDNDYSIYKVRTTIWTLDRFIGGRLKYIKNIKTKNKVYNDKMNKLVKIMEE